MNEPTKPANEPKEPKLVEGKDYYFENGLMVLTEHFLLKRGYCCENDCRHCPYGFVKEGDSVAFPRNKNKSLPAQWYDVSLR